MGVDVREPTLAPAGTNGASPAPGATPRLLAGIAAVLIVVTCAVFGRAVVEQFDFLYYDDHDYVFRNPRVATGLTLENVRWAFRPSTRVASNWHPLTLLSHMLDCQVFGLASWGHHLTSLGWHVANVLLLFAVLLRLTNAAWRSALVAALFAWHPLRAESVAWIAERKDLICAACWLLAIWFYADFARRRGAWRYLAVCLCLGLGLLAKPMIVTLPGTLLLLDNWPLERYPRGPHDRTSGLRRTGQLLLEKLPLFVIVAVGCVITLKAQQGAIASWERVTLGNRLINALLSYDKYLWMTLWPRGLATPYVLDVGALSAWKGLLAAVPLGVLSGIVICFRRAKPYAFVGWFWYLGTLVPVIGLIQVGVQALADRYTYVPQIGLFLIVAWGLGDLVAVWPKLRWPVVATMTAILTLLAVLTFQQVGHWRNTFTLLHHTVDVTGPNIPAQIGLAAAYLGEKQYAEAIAEADRIIGQQAGYFEAYYVRGRALRESGRPVEAADTFATALTSADGEIDARRYVQLALAAAQVFAAHPDESARDSERAVQLAEMAGKVTRYRDPVVLDTLAAAYANAGRFDEAIARAEVARRLAIDSRRSALAASIERRLQGYRNRQPYRDDLQTPEF